MRWKGTGRERPETKKGEKWKTVVVGFAAGCPSAGVASSSAEHTRLGLFSKYTDGLGIVIRHVSLPQISFTDSGH